MVLSDLIVPEMSPIVDNNPRQVHESTSSLNIGCTKVNTISRIVSYDLRSAGTCDLWTNLGISHCVGQCNRKDEITRGDAAKYYYNNGHKDWCVFTHEYVEYNAQ